MLLAGAAAFASIRGEEAAGRIAGSGWFLLLAGVVLIQALGAAVGALVRRPAGWPWLLAAHLGLAVGLLGVGLNQLPAGSGWLLLEAGAGPQNFCLDRSRRAVRPLPFAVRLDSLTAAEWRGFRPAPVAWLSAGPASPAPVTYSRPLQHAGLALLLLRPVGPGTPLEFSLSLDGTDYLLLHNQHARTADGRDVWSCAWDSEQRRLALAVGDSLVWLAPGDTLRIGSATIALGPVRLSRRPGAVFAVRSGRRRPLVFAGFALMLLGAAGTFFRRETA